MIEPVGIAVILVSLKLDTVRLRLKHVEEAERNIESSNVFAFEAEEVCQQNCQKSAHISHDQHVSKQTSRHNTMCHKQNMILHSFHLDNNSPQAINDV